MNRIRIFLFLFLTTLNTLPSAHAGTVETDFEPTTITAVETLEEDGQPWIRLQLDPRLPLHFVGDGAIAYGMFRIHPRHDKARHIMAGYVISNVSTGLLQLYLPDNLEHRSLVAGLIGFGAGAMAGIAKEMLDAQGYGTPSIQDAAATALGAGLGALTLNLTLDLKFSKTKKRRTL